MKKYKYYLFLLLSLFILLVSGCDNKKDEEKTDKTELVDDENHINVISEKDKFSLVEGDVYNPFFNVDKKYSFKSTDENVIKVDAKGKVTAIGAGKAKVEVYKDGQKYAFATFNITKAPTINPNFDEALFAEFLAKDTNDSNDITVSVKTKVRGVESEVITKARKNPGYFEIDSLNNVSFVKESSLIKDKYFLYNVNENLKSIDRTLIKPSDMSEYSAEAVNDMLNLFEGVDTSKLELNKIAENKYNIKTMLKDISGLADSYLEELEMFGDFTKNAVVNMDATFEENKTTIDITISMHFIYENIIFDMPVAITLTADYSPIVEFDTKDYTISDPTSVEEVDEVGKIDEFFIEGSTKCILADVKAGRYSFELVDDLFFTDGLRIKVYDKDLNELECSEIPHGYYHHNIINIPADGYYYFEFKSTHISNQKCKMELLDSNTPSAKELKSASGEIESKYDYDLYTYESKNDNEVLKINNLSNSRLYLYIENATTSNWNGFTTVEADKEIYINPEEDSRIYVVSAIKEKNASNDYDYKYQYNFSVESIVNDYGTDEKNPVELKNDTYSDKFMIGYKLKPRTAILKAEKKGIYGFTAMGLSGQEERFNISLKNVTAPNNGWEYNLEPGEYEVLISANDHVFDIASIRYYFVDISDKDVKIELLESDSLIEYDTQAYTEEQKVRYMFDLEKDCYLILNPRFVAIYNLNDKAVTPQAPNTAVDYMYFKFKAGSYYALNLGSYYQSLYMCISKSIPTKYADLTAVPDYKENEYYVIEETDHYYSAGLGKFVAEKSKIKIVESRVYCEVFDENMKAIVGEYENGNYVYNLEVGKTYYILFSQQERYTKALFYYRYI